MDKKYSKIIVKSINELKEALSSPGVDEIVAVVNEVSAWVLTNKATRLNQEEYLYEVCDKKYLLESTFYKYADETSADHLELMIHFKAHKDKAIFIVYDYNYDFETKIGKEGTAEIGFNDVKQKINENESFDIHEIALYVDGSEEAMIGTPNTYLEQITNIIKSTNLK